MTYTQLDYLNILNNDLVEMITILKNSLNETLPIAGTHQFRGGARLRNIQTLMNYLNQHNAHQIIGNDVNRETITNYTNHVINQINQSYERNYNQNIANNEIFYEDEVDESDIEYCEQIQNQINREYQNKRGNEFFKNFDKTR